MGPGAGLNRPAAAPGVGLGWSRLAEHIGRALPPGEIDAVWAFPNLRRDGREWGTAVVARRSGERRRIYTARYVLVLKGKERGQFEAELEEVGSGPVEALATLLRDVHQRTDDEHPPVPVPLAAWFPPPEDPDDGPAR
ncbi:MAG TPA: hypothetical protein VFW66_11035 [Gemmatimonadales bacterium]|nr:hypothetical protein [Gemmatimonadales bacterium]